MIEEQPSADTFDSENQNGFFSQNDIDNSPRRTENDDIAYKRELPEVPLFKSGSGVSINDTAEYLGEICSKKETLFLREGGGDAGQQVQIVDESRKLSTLSPALACSEFEKVCKLIFLVKRKPPIPAVMSISEANRIIACENFTSRLPRLRIITKCPVIIQRPSGDIKIINKYDRDSGIFAAGNLPVMMDIDEAIEIVLSIIEEFDFKTPADKSRCIAVIISVALNMGSISKFRMPMVLIEADESQSGKGYLAKIIAAIYSDVVYICNQHNGGVGSLEETISERLIEGRNFISIDNLTAPKQNGIFNSEKICSLMTEDTFSARVPYKGSVIINPGRHVFFITTNGCTLSIDLMNRSCPISIRKRHNYKFKSYLEGSVLDHIRHNPAKFQGAIFSIVLAWCEAGKPRSSTTAHDSSFTPWAQSLDAIVQDIMGQAPLLEGYEHVRDRITSPYLQMLRDIALAVVKYRNDESLTVSDIIEEVGHEGVTLPGMKAGCDFDKLTENDKNTVKKQFGILFGRAFKYHGHDDVLDLNGIKITRKAMPTTYPSGTTKDLKYYIFSKQGDIQ